MPLLKTQRTAARALAEALGEACEATGCRSLGEVAAELHSNLDNKRGRSSIKPIVGRAVAEVAEAGDPPEELARALSKAQAEIAKPSRRRGRPRKPKGETSSRSASSPPKPKAAAPKPQPRATPSKAQATTQQPARPGAEVTVRLPVEALAALAADGWTVRLERG